MNARQYALREYRKRTLRMATLQAQLIVVARERAEFIAALADTGMTYAEIAELIGVKPARVGQMIASLRR